MTHWRVVLLAHKVDADEVPLKTEGEWAHYRKSRIQELDKAWTEALAKG